MENQIDTEATNENDMGHIELPHMKDDPESAYSALLKIIDHLNNIPEDNEDILNNALEIKAYYEENSTFLEGQFEWIKMAITPQKEELPEFIPNEPLEPIDDPEDEKRKADAIERIKANQKLRDEEAPGSTPAPDSVVLPTVAEDIEKFSETGKVVLEGGEIATPDVSPSGEELTDEKAE